MAAAAEAMAVDVTEAVAAAEAEAMAADMAVDVTAAVAAVEAEAGVTTATTTVARKEVALAVAWVTRPVPLPTTRLNTLSFSRSSSDLCGSFGANTNGVTDAGCSNMLVCACQCVL
jgi:hypothetical protein